MPRSLVSFPLQLTRPHKTFSCPSPRKQQASNNNTFVHSTSIMAEEDDLDAFFDEVSEVEAKVVEATETDKAESPTGCNEEEPPAKRIKTSAPVRPRGVVVAASTSVVMPAKEREQKEAEAEQASQKHQSSHVPTTQPAGYSIARVGPSSSIGPSPTASVANPQKAAEKKKSAPKVSVRTIAGETWVDQSLEDWPDNDYRIFVGNLSNEVNDEMLFKHFEKYPSLARARVVRDSKNPEKSKGYGFVSLLDPLEMARALRQMDQTWLASRPIRIKRSDWKERDYKSVKNRQKKEKKQQKRMGMR